MGKLVYGTISIEHDLASCYDGITFIELSWMKVINANEQIIFSLKFLCLKSTNEAFRMSNEKQFRSFFWWNDGLKLIFFTFIFH